MKEYLQVIHDSNVAPVEKVTSEQALKLVQEGDLGDHTGFDAAEAERLGLKSGQIVAVAPTDTGA